VGHPDRVPTSIAVSIWGECGFPAGAAIGHAQAADQQPAIAQRCRDEIRAIFDGMAAKTVKRDRARLLALLGKR